MNALQKNIGKIVTLSILLCIMLMACVRHETAMSAEPLILGAVFSLTGGKSDLGIPSSKGAELAVNQLNAAGGVNGREVTLVLTDGKSDPEAVRRRVEEIVDHYPDVPALFGLTDTDLARSAGEASAKKSRVFLTSGATSPLLPDQVPDYLYLACFGDNVQAAAAAEWAYNELGARTAAVLYDSAETYTILLHKYFIDRFDSLGGKVMATRKYDPADMSRFGQGLPRADVVFLAAGSARDAQERIQKLRAAGFTMPIVGGDGYDSEVEWERHPEVKDVYYTTHVYLGADSPNSLVRNFSQAYHKAYGGNAPDAFAALSYDAVNLLAEAVRRAETTSPDAVRRTLAGIEDFRGVTGTISYAGGRRVPRKSVTLIEVKNGQRNFITAFIPDVIPPP
jgi:branched-chain amino acid transport system substrate-binding protein